MGKRSFKLAHRRKIIAEAYSKPFNIRATARAHKIHPSMIRNWKKTMHKAAQEGKTVNSDGARLLISPRKAKEDDIYPELFQYYKSLRLEHHAVSTRGLITRAIQLKPELAALERRTVEQRIYRWLHRNNISKRRKTNVAQPTTIGDARQIAAWVRYIQS